jgi:hypothetical protein
VSVIKLSQRENEMLYLGLRMDEVQGLPGRALINTPGREAEVILCRRGQFLYRLRWSTKVWLVGDVPPALSAKWLKGPPTHRSVVISHEVHSSIAPDAHSWAQILAPYRISSPILM